MNDPAYEPVERLRRQQILTWVLIALLVAVFVLPSVKAWLGYGFKTGTPRTVTPRGELANFEKTTVELFRTVSPSVVFVTVSKVRLSPFTRRGIEVQEGSGSGFVWDDAGHIVTNYHVLQSGKSANVIMHDQSSYRATLVGASANHDLAVLKVTAPAAQIRPVAIGDSSSLEVGQFVCAIGNPFGLSHTFTTGVVSAKSRTIGGPSGRAIEDVIQIDAAINPGNSGGPLLDSAGRLIGVNTAIYSPSGASAGVGFAIPVDTVNRVVPQLIAKGRYQPPQLGTLINTDLSRRVTSQLGVSGVLIAAVEPNSGADKAGLRGTEIAENRVQLGDIIQAINDREIETMNDLALALEEFEPGDTVDVKVLRNGDVQTVEVTLD